MLNLLKSDFYRLLHGKIFWVTIAFLAVSISFMLWSFQALATTNGINSEDLNFSITTTESIDRMTMNATHLYGSTFFSNGLLNLVSCLFIVLVLSTDFETGFMKSIWTTRGIRKVYMAEKLILCAVASACFLGLSILFTLGSAYALGLTVQAAENSDELAMWIFLAWLSTTAYVFIAAAVVLVSRSKTVGLIVAVLLSTELIDNLIIAFCQLISPAAPLALSIPPWLLSNNLRALAAGSAGIMPSAAHLMLIAGSIIVLCSIVTALFATHKDVRS